MVRGGGLAGISTRTELDADALPPHEADTLAGLVDRAGLRGGVPARPPLPRADQQLYEIEVTDNEAEARSRFGEDDLPDEVRELVAWVDARPEHTRRILT